MGFPSRSLETRIPPTGVQGGILAHRTTIRAAGQVNRPAGSADYPAGQVTGPQEALFNLQDRAPARRMGYSHSRQLI